MLTQEQLIEMGYCHVGYNPYRVCSRCGKH